MEKSVEIPADANDHCPGPESESAGKSDTCAGCPNQGSCASGPKAPDPDLTLIAERMENVKHKILVFSGKGGVGKSTFSAQLAFALAAMEFEVGLLDIDICGPSIPKMLGLEGQTLHQSNIGWSPVYVDSNLGVISVGLALDDPDVAVAVRGPRKTVTIKQFVRDVHWGELDFLVVDAPPGSSDEQISIVQFLEATGIDGCVIVTTPQQVALSDVRKGIDFCKKAKLKILGVVENMSGLSQQLNSFKFTKINSNGIQEDVSEWALKSLKDKAPELLNLFACTEVYDSTAGGAAQMCAELSVPFLGKIPLDPQLCKAADEGRSIFSDHEAHVSAPALRSIIQQLLTILNIDRNTTTTSL